MNLKGTENIKRRVEIEISVKDALQGIAKEYGAENLLCSDICIDTIVCQKDSDKVNHFYIKTKKDISYHGSPIYKEIKRTEISEDVAMLLKHIKEVFLLNKKIEKTTKDK